MVLAHAVVLVTKDHATEALLARLDERSAYQVKESDRQTRMLEKVDRDLSGIGARLSATEATMDTHRWSLRLIAGTLLVAIISAVVRVILGD